MAGQFHAQSPIRGPARVGQVEQFDTQIGRRKFDLLISGCAVPVGEVEIEGRVRPTTPQPAG